MKPKHGGMGIIEVSKELKKSAAEKRMQKEIREQDKQRRYADMAIRERRASAEKHFRHKPYGRME